MAHEPSPGHGHPDQDPLGGGPAAERDRPATPDGFVNGSAGRREPPPGQAVPPAPADPPKSPGRDTEAGWDQADAEDDWDQDAALDAFVAAIEAGQVPIPPDDSGEPGGYVPPDVPGSPASGPETPASTGPGRSSTGSGQTSAEPGQASGKPGQASAPSAGPGPGSGAPRECIDAGFLPRDAPPGPAAEPGRPASGFASGALLDRALPGPAVAGFLDAAAGADRGYAGVDDDQLIGMLVKWQQTEAWAASGRLSAVAELIRRRPGDSPPDPAAEGLSPAWGKFCDDELAVATATSKIAAGKTLALAYDLAARLPGTAQALREGVIDAYKAQIIADATRVLDDAGAAAAEALILPDIAGKTPGQIRVAAGRAVLTVDPEAGRQRRERAQKDARVELWREDAGTAALCGYSLPPDEALAADQAISARARELKAAGLAGTIDQLRVRAYLDTLLGKDSLATLAADTQPAAPETTPDGRGDASGDGSGSGDGSARPRAPGDGSLASDAPDQPVPAGPGPGTTTEPDDCAGGTAEPGQVGNLPGAANRSGAARTGDPAGLSARMNLTIPLATLLGLAERPGEAAGFGAIDPDLARAMAAMAATSPWTTWCLTVTDEHGHPVAHGCARRTPGARATSTSPPVNGPGPPVNGPGPPVNGPGRRPAPAFSRGSGPGPPGGYGTWRLRTGRDGPPLTVDIEPVPVTDCDHRHETGAYEPGDRLRHLVEIRDGECTWPPCRRNARRTDFEHAIPWDQGGRTCACNAGARCRHHHHAKQAPGWRLDQNQPGYHTWTTPSGRQYTTGPITYPV
jgi:hypothetical protein